MTLLDGIVYMRHRETEEDWRQAPMPDGFHDTLIGISLDADRLIGVDEDGWLYTMKKTLGEPEDFRWIRAWGGPTYFRWFPNCEHYPAPVVSFRHQLGAGPNLHGRGWTSTSGVFRGMHPGVVSGEQGTNHCEL